MKKTIIGPTIEYNVEQLLSSNSTAEEVTLGNRAGVGFRTLHEQCMLRNHTLNERQGTMTIWIACREDLSSFPHWQHIAEHHPDYRDYVIVTDRLRDRKWQKSAFSIVWSGGWYPVFWAKFYRGNIYMDAYDPPRALVTANHYYFHRETWQQLAVSWNRDESSYKMYVNGVCIGSSDQFSGPLEEHPGGRSLFVGHPCFLIGDLEFYDKVLTQTALKDCFMASSREEEQASIAVLEKTYGGKGLKTCEFDPGSWQLAYETDFPEEAGLSDFYIQGNPNAHQWSDEGLEIETPEEMVDEDENEQSQVYYWLKKWFEGDLALSLDFKIHSRGGLALLMLQSSGMQREDLFSDHPPRSSGSMRTVHRENVRNYHLEFYREMADTRNDVANVGLVKDPLQRPLAFQCLDRLLELGVWHRFQYVQEGPRLRGILNGVQVFDVEDEPFQYSGGFLHCGYVALRFMKRTRMTIRSLRIYQTP
ncbi:MAG: DUF1961 family protein [Opitutales bacterium]|nr:DUF1961 family protein [Opitutales bacterium]